MSSQSEELSQLAVDLHTDRTARARENKCVVQIRDADVIPEPIQKKKLTTFNLYDITRLKHYFIFYQCSLQQRRA